ncbi:MAG: c-type cytochrome domain-containing protein [Polyangiaceae bacterium]
MRAKVEPSKLQGHSMMPSEMKLIGFLLVFTTVLSCSGADETQSAGPPPRCIENLNVDCTDVLYPSSAYSTIFEKLVQPQCAIGSSCHGANGAMGGLVLANADEAYDALLGTKGGTKHVVPGDPTCSPLMVRLESRDANFQMPRGSRFSEPALCNFIQWIKQGAQKN